MKILESHKKPGIYGLFGLPFFLAGCFFLYAIIEPSMKWNGDRPPLYIGIPFCSVFIGIGALILFGCSGFKLDPVRRKGMTYWGIMIPLFRKHFSFSNVEYVHLTSEVRRNKNSTYTVYPIKLKMKDKKSIKVETAGRNYLIARELAEKIARDCKFKLRNEKEGNQIIKTNEVDPSFRDKAKENRQIPIAPNECHITYSDQFDSFQIQSKFKQSWLIAIIPITFTSLILIPIIIFFQSNFSMIKEEGPIYYIFILFFTIPLLTVIYKSLKKVTKGFQVNINRNEIIIKYIGLWKRKEVIALDNIDDIEPKSFKLEYGRNMLLNKKFSFNFSGVHIICGNKTNRIAPFKTSENEKYFFELLMYGISRNS